MPSSVSGRRCAGAPASASRVCVAPPRSSMKRTPSFVGLVEEHGRRVEAHARVVDVVVVGDGAAARAHQLDHADARGQPQRGFVEAAAVRIGHGLEPGRQRRIDAGRHALQQRLEQVVVGVDPARVDHAVGGVEHPFARLGAQAAAHLVDQAVVADAQVAGGAARAVVRRAAGEHGRGIADQHQFISLSCQRSAHFDSAAIAVNSTMPVSVIRNSAANSRGMFSWKPDCRIW